MELVLSLKSGVLSLITPFSALELKTFHLILTANFYVMWH